MLKPESMWNLNFASLCSLWISTLGVVALLSGCATSAPQSASNSCKNMDWYEIGRTDGTQGEQASTINRYRERCNFSQTEFKASEELYHNGWNLGLLEYCTPTAGLESAKEGHQYEHVCPEYLEPKFLTGFELGQKIQRLEDESNQVETRIERLAKMMARSPASFNAAGGTSYRTKLKQELDALRERHAQIDDEISNLENQSL